MCGMLTGERVFSAERTDYLKDIAALRIKVARVEQLEAENGRLKAEVEEAGQRHQEPSNADENRSNRGVKRPNATLKAGTETKSLTVDVEEYNRVKEDLTRLESDYGKLVWARDHLEAKVREQKDSLRQWKEYRKSWILKHPNKRLSHLRPSSAKASSFTTVDIRRSSSAPAPPAVPEGLTPSPSGVSRSPSPHRNAETDSKNKEKWHERAVEHHEDDRGSQSHGVDTSQAECISAKGLGSEDVTDATPESEGQAEPIKNEPAPGGSSPIIVFERSLKRRHSARADVRNIHVHEDNQGYSGAAPSNLSPKDEQISSPIQAPPLIHLDGPHDSLDLDDVGGHLDTPRKRQRKAQERLRSSMMLPLTAAQGEEDMPGDMTSHANVQYFDEEPPEVESERDKRANLSTEKHNILPEKGAEEDKNARRGERMARQHAHNDRVYQRLEVAERMAPLFNPPRSSSPTTDKSAQQPHTPNEPREFRQRKPHADSPVILQPRSINASVLPRTSDPSANRKRPCPPSRRDRGAACIPVVAEDGEGHLSDRDALEVGKKDRNNLQGPSEDRESKAPSSHRRLEALLTKPSPEKSLLIPEEPFIAVSPDQTWSKTPLPQSVYHSRSKGLATPRSLPAKRTESKRSPGDKPGLAGFGPIDGTLDKYSKSAQVATKRTRDVPVLSRPSHLHHPEIRPEHEPLRARPIHRLGLQDFKFNPAHSDHAYHESVRKHDEKKALSGCTDRHCSRCKGLRKHVIDSGYKTTRKPGESEDEADWRLMQDYLGDNRRQLRGMSATERSDLLLEAKIKEFANRYGCHRQAFPRTREPPGLWQVDFPTTQEEAENRLAADVMEREKVQERYWEATRPKGKWMFADE